MEFNLPPKVRQVLYSANVLLAPLVAYLGTQGRLDTFWVGLYSVVAGAVFALAGFNVSKK